MTYTWEQDLRYPPKWDFRWSLRRAGRLMWPILLGAKEMVCILDEALRVSELNGVWIWPPNCLVKILGT